MNPVALAASLLLHATVAVWLLVALPDFGDRLPVANVVSVELVDLSDDGDTPATVPAEAAPLPERQATRTPDPSPPETEPTPAPAGAEAPAPAPQPEPVADPLPEPEPAATAEPEPEPQPLHEPPAVAERAPEPEPIPEPEPEPAAEPVVVEPEPEPAPAPEPAREPAPNPTADVADTPAVEAPPRRRPELAQAETTAQPEGVPQPNPDARQEEREEPDPLDALLQSVEQLNRRVEAETPREGTGRDAAPAPDGALAQLRAQQLGRLIYEQIIGCWNVPRGLEGLREVGGVAIRTEFTPAGEVLDATVEDEARLQTDRVFRSVAESAQRAIYNCTPLRGMPAEDYAQWRVVILEFRPEMIAAGG